MASGPSFQSRGSGPWVLRDQEVQAIQGAEVRSVRRGEGMQRGAGGEGKVGSLLGEHGEEEGEEGGGGAEGSRGRVKATRRRMLGWEPQRLRQDPEP